MEQTNQCVPTTKWYAELAGAIAGLAASYTTTSILKANLPTPKGIFGKIAFLIGVPAIGAVVSTACQNEMTNSVQGYGEAFDILMSVFKKG